MPPLDTSRDHGVAFLDLETTGLYPWAGAEPWEVALITQDPEPEEVTDAGDNVRTFYPWVEFVWHLPVDLGKADPITLRIGRFHERYVGSELPSTVVSVVPDHDHGIRTDRGEWARGFARLTHGKHLVGAVPSFDAESATSLAGGRLPSSTRTRCAPWTLASSCARRGTPRSCRARWASTPDAFEKHTALGDARWAKAIYEQVMT